MSIDDGNEMTAEEETGTDEDARRSNQMALLDPMGLINSDFRQEQQKRELRKRVERNSSRLNRDYGSC